MNYQVVKSKEMYFVGKFIRVNNAKTEVKKQAGKLWNETMNNGGYEFLKKHTSLKRPISLVFEINPDKEEASYLVGVEVESYVDLAGYETVIVPKSKFLKFESEASSVESLHKLKEDIFTNFVSDNKFEFAPIAEIEKYTDHLNTEDLNKFEYWITIV